MNKILVGFFILLLTACTASGPKPVKFDRTLLRDQLAQLPGVQLVDSERIVFSYPGSVLFETGAVLPLPGGTALLDPLANFFQANTGLPWQVEVRAGTARGKAYDQRLAEKRSELLKTYLQSKGVQLAEFEFQSFAAQGDPLVFTLKTVQQAEKL